MQLNSRKELRHQRIEQALKKNLRKRKIFLNKTNKEKKKVKKWLVYLIVILAITVEDINPKLFLIEANNQKNKDELKKRTEAAHKKGVFHIYMHFVL